MRQSVPIKGLQTLLYLVPVRLILMYSFLLQTEAIPGIGIAQDVQLKLVDWFHINLGAAYNITLK